MAMEGQTQGTALTATGNKDNLEFANPEDLQEILFCNFAFNENEILDIGEPGMDLATQVVVLNDESGGPEALGPEKSYAQMTLMDFENLYTQPEPTILNVEAPEPGASVKAIATETKRSPRKSRVQTKGTVGLNEDDQYFSSKAKTPKGRRGAASKRTFSVSSMSPEVSSTRPAIQKEKKVKLYESDIPQAKNAKAAKLNREKKKKAMESLKLENSSLQSKLSNASEALEQALGENKFLNEKVKELENKNRAVIGLNRISQSTKELLDGVMPTLMKNFGIYNVSCAPWFGEVTTVTPDVGAIADAPTSSYVTMHISMADKHVMVDYRPDEPHLSNDIPE